MDLFIGAFFASFGNSIQEAPKTWTAVRICLPNYTRHVLLSVVHIALLFLPNCCYYRNPNNSRCAELYLGRSERTKFVNVVLKLIDRGQYSKDKDLSETVAVATSILSFVEPSLVLPFVASRYYIALETVSVCVWKQ